MKDTNETELTTRESCDKFGYRIITYYNADERLIKRERYYKDGDMCSVDVYEYDAGGKEIRCVTYGRHPRYSTMELCEVREYNSEGTMIKYELYDFGALRKREEYNSDGKTIKVESCNLSEKTREITEYNFDGTLVKKTFYDADGKITWWYVIERDSNGNWIKAVYYDADGKITKWRAYEYNSNGKRTKTVDYDADDKITGWCSYERDSDGKCTKEVLYDADGNILEEREPLF